MNSSKPEKFESTADNGKRLEQSCNSITNSNLEYANAIKVLYRSSSESSRDTLMALSVQLDSLSMP
jgi:hypothetical protein